MKCSDSSRTWAALSGPGREQGSARAIVELVAAGRAVSFPLTRLVHQAINGGRIAIARCAIEGGLGGGATGR